MATTADAAAFGADAVGGISWTAQRTETVRLS
jgi:hypothetical protein